MSIYSKFAKLALPVAVGAFYAASPFTAAHAAPKTMSIALPGDLPGLDPSKDSSPLGFNYRLNVFDALTELMPDGEMNPRLAESWEFSDDLLEWTFSLRQNATFHDGSALTADDVVFTVNRIQNDPSTPVRTFLRLVDGVEALDDHTVKFTLNQPYSIFHRQISYVNIMSRSYWDEVGDDGYARAPVGTGPYKFIEWQRDDRLVLEANEEYWRGAPAVKTAIFRPMPSEAARMNALMTGEIDLVPALPPSFLNQLERDPNIDVGTAPSFRTIFLGLNVTKPYLDDPKLREAIDVGIDRVAIAEQLLRGLDTPAGMMIPPNNVGFDPTLEPVVFDPEAARQLVEESNYNGETIRIQYPNNNIVMANEVVQGLAGYMTEIGLNIEIVPLEFTAFFPLWLQSEIDDIYFFAFGSSQYHGETALVTMYEEGSHSYRVNPEIDRILKEQRTVVDDDEKRQMLSQAYQLSNEDRFNIPVYHEWQAFGVRGGISYDPWPDGFIRLYDFQ